MDDKRLVLKFALNMCTVGSIWRNGSGQSVTMVPMEFGAMLVANNLVTAAVVIKALDLPRVVVTQGELPLLELIFEQDETDMGLAQVRKMLTDAGFEVTEVGEAPWLEILRNQRK